MAVDHLPERGSGRRVEFLDDTGEAVELADDAAARAGWRRHLVVRRPAPFSLVVSGGMVAGAVITIVSVYMTQLFFHPFKLGRIEPTYALTGFGRFHLVGRGTPRYAFGGRGPALGEVAIVGALALLVAAAAGALLAAGSARSAANAVACLAAGVIVATVGCEATEAGEFLRHSWAAGFWLLLVGACVAALAALGSAVHGQRDAIRASGSEAK